MTAIAERVGLAKASLYEYFGTKDDVFLALARRDVESWADEVESRLKLLRRADAGRVAAALTAALRSHARLLRLRLTVLSIVERRAAADTIAEFNHAFRVAVQRAADALNAACPQLTREQVNEFIIQHQAVNTGLWSITHASKAASDRSGFRAIRFDFFELFERTIYQILRGVLEVSGHRRRKADGKNSANGRSARVGAADPGP
jgi:AcrR family transcriptional regulator